MRAYIVLIILAVASGISVAYEKPPEEGQMFGVNGGYGAYGVLFASGCASRWNKYTLFDYYFLNMRYAKRWKNWQIDSTLTYHHDIERWHIYIEKENEGYSEDAPLEKPVAKRRMASVSLSESVFATYLHKNVEVSFGLGFSQPLMRITGGEEEDYFDFFTWQKGFWIYPVVALKVGDMEKAYLGGAMNMYDQGMHTSKLWIGGYPDKKVHIFGGGGMAVPTIFNYGGYGYVPSCFAGIEVWAHERVLLTGTFSYNFLDRHHASPSNGFSFNLGAAFTF